MLDCLKRIFTECWIVIRGETWSAQWKTIYELRITNSTQTREVRETRGCRDRAVVRALASHQCGPGSIPRSGVKCGLSLLVLFSTPRGFLRVLRFPLSSKTKI